MVEVNLYGNILYSVRNGENRKASASVRNSKNAFQQRIDLCPTNVFRMPCGLLTHSFLAFVACDISDLSLSLSRQRVSEMFGAKNKRKILDGNDFPVTKTAR